MCLPEALLTVAAVRELSCCHWQHVRSVPTALASAAPCLSIPASSFREKEGALALLAVQPMQAATIPSTPPSIVTKEAPRSDLQARLYPAHVHAAQRSCCCCCDSECLALLQLALQWAGAPAVNSLPRCGPGLPSQHDLEITPSLHLQLGCRHVLMCRTHSFPPPQQ